MAVPDKYGHGHTRGTSKDELKDPLPLLFFVSAIAINCETLGQDGANSRLRSPGSSHKNKRCPRKIPESTRQRASKLLGHTLGHTWPLAPCDPESVCHEMPSLDRFATHLFRGPPATASTGLREQVIRNQFGGQNLGSALDKTGMQ